MNSGWYKPKGAHKAHYFRSRVSACKKHKVGLWAWWRRVRWQLRPRSDIPCRTCVYGKGDYVTPANVVNYIAAEPPYKEIVPDAQENQTPV